MEVAKSVLYVGPDYKDHRGGIGAVLETYAANYKTFKFVATYNYKNKIKLVTFYIRSLCKILWLLIHDRVIKIVHLHSASNGSFVRKSIIVLLAKMFKKKVIFHIHGGGFNKFYENSGKLKGVIRFILREADIIVCLSPQWQEYFSSIVDSKKIRIVFNPVEKGQFKNSVLVSSKKIQYLFLGKICDSKGVFDLLKAIQQLNETTKRLIKLVVCGNGEVQRFNDLLKELNLESLVDFKGWISGDEKISLLTQSDVYVLPSYIEGLPVSILEAMSFGLPIISTPVGGIPEIVKNNVNGFLIEPGDINRLSEALKAFVINKDMYAAFSSKSNEMVKPYLSTQVMNHLNEIYSQLLSNKDT
jgi:glycosyltransferase involved in cell wall biosynthesis